ncbi:MAG: hypothetical protein AB1797_03810 [bacterium]
MESRKLRQINSKPRVSLKWVRNLKLKVLVATGILLFITFSLTWAQEKEEKPTLKLPEVEIVGEDKSKLKREKGEIEKPSLPESPLPWPEETIQPEEEEPVTSLKPPPYDKISGGKKRDERPPISALSSFKLSYDSLNTLYYQYVYGQQTKQTNYLLTMERKRSDGFSWHDRANFDQFSRDRLAGDISFYLNRGNLSAEMTYLGEDTFLPYPDKEDQEKVKATSITLSGQIYTSDRADLTFRTYFHESLFSGEEDSDNRLIGADLGYHTYWLPAQNPLSLGLRAYQDKVSDGDERFYTFLYAESNSFLIKPFLFDIGLELNGSDQEALEQIDFLIRFSSPWGEKVTLFAAAERELHIPTYGELYVESKYWRVNHEIEPERIMKYQLGAHRQLTETSSLKATLFIKDVEDLIIWREDRDQLYKPENMEEALLWGGELNLTHTIANRFIQTLHYQYTEAEGKEKDDHIPHLPVHKGELQVGYNDGELRIELGGEYVSHRYADIGKEKLDSYMLLNVLISEKPGRNLTLFMEGENLLDEEDALERQDYPLPGLQVRAGVTVKF